MDQKLWHNLLQRPPEANKYDYGHVLVIGGSEAMVGAPVLAARAALRTGAGLVSIASDSATVGLIDRDIEEVMTLALPAWDDSQKIFEVITSHIQKRQVSTLVIGPGLPQAADETIKTLIARLELPTILDAEAFTALRGNLSVLQSATATNANIILTPHQGEFARLILQQANYTDLSEKKAVMQFAQDYQVTLILKHHHTLIANNQGRLHVNTSGNPGLATAGAGDVLTGILAGIVAQHINDPFEAAKMAVYLHGLAGDIATESKTEPGMIASDIIESIPTALLSLNK